MELKDFEFDLPEALIAQHPLPERDSSRLMVLHRGTGEIFHRQFRDLPEYLRKGDLLVLNDTKVIPARLPGRKSTGGQVEVLLVERLSTEGGERWTALIRNSKGLKPGSKILFEKGVEGEVAASLADGMWECAFNEGFSSCLDEIGKTPLPPYIRREAVEEDRKRYQTVFAGAEGAVAAPTAGLHFTGPLLDELKGAGVEICHLTLHTGPGTFMPVRAERLEDHRVLKERYSVPNATAEAVKRAKKDGRRVMAVGTTATRALESAFMDGLEAPVLNGSTELFIFPGFAFKVVDGLVTNFHLPGSTLLMLVSAFAGHEKTMKAYNEAVKEGYRFFSYGDAMLIV